MIQTTGGEVYEWWSRKPRETEEVQAGHAFNKSSAFSGRASMGSSGASSDCVGGAAGCESASSCNCAKVLTSAIGHRPDGSEGKDTAERRLRRYSCDNFNGPAVMQVAFLPEGNIRAVYKGVIRGTK